MPSRGCQDLTLNGSWKKLGHEGLNKILDSYPNKSAYALCTFSFAWGPNEDPITFTGRTDGKIVLPRGPTNFGWDPIFQPDGFNDTFAEMRKETKNSISHRRRALDKLLQYLSESNEKLTEKK